jgi:alkanesulfonate monooxygenase SsuD/methylene tetrahydromethanopterin reductase-like flavin-dependent oxidoreductase (luciferase family)
LADGWFPLIEPGPELDDARAVVEQAARGAGRDPAAIGMEGRAIYAGDTDAVAAELAAWKKAGATHVSVSTMDAGLGTVDDHLAVLATVAESLPGR